MTEQSDFQPMEASYNLGKQVGRMIERQVILAMLDELPSQFSHNDYAYRAIAKAKKMIKELDDAANL